MEPVPLWLKIGTSLFVLLLIPVNWRQYGPANFLWFSDLALFMIVAALWLESSLLASMAALAVLIPETAWNLDFFWRLLTGKSGIGLSSYMFNSQIALPIRSVSLFHVWLPVLLGWAVAHFGYDRSALAWQTLFCFVVLPASYLLGDAATNPNWVHGFGDPPKTWISPRLFPGVLMAAFPLLIYLPTHFLLRRWR